MIYKTQKSTLSGYTAPEAEVLSLSPEGVLAASVNMGEPTINDMEEWNGWEE